MIQLCFPFFKDFGRTLEAREITSVNLPRNFFPPPNAQIGLPFRKRRHRNRVNRRSGARHKKALFKGKLTVDCLYCENPITYDKATIEHIVPLAEGGINLRSNVAIACGPCNHHRQNMPPDVWKELVMTRGNRGHRKAKVYQNSYVMLYDLLKLKGRLLERKYLK
jgi:hypothetical protein